MVVINDTKCLRCGHEWSRMVPAPIKCSKCNSTRWNKEPKLFNRKKKSPEQNQIVPEEIIEEKKNGGDTDTKIKSWQS